MNLREALSALRQQWRLHKLEAARERLDHLLKTTPRYWTAASIGGVVNLQLGKVTADQAAKACIDAGHHIAFVDVDNAFVTLTGDPNAADSL